MKFQELSEAEKVNVKKHIKEELRPSQNMKNVVEIVNPNQLDYKYVKGGLQIQGKLVGFDSNQIKGAVIRNVKDKLKKVA